MLNNLFSLFGATATASRAILRSLVAVVGAVLCAISAFAVDIPAGTFYFDNSLTKYSQVKFVYGRDDSNDSYVV